MTMSTAIEYQKVMSEIVYVNLPGPDEPVPGMNGTDLLHGFLTEFHRTQSPEVKAFVDSACLKWNVHYRIAKDT